MRRYALPLVLIVLVALGVWWFAELEPSAARAPLPQPAEQNSPPALDASRLEAGTSGAREATALPAEPSEPAPPPKDTQHPTGTVRAHCIDDSGRPIEGVELQGDGAHTLAKSGPDGRVEGALKLWRADGGEMWIVLREAFHVKRDFTRVLLPDAVCDLGDVVLAPAGRIEGRVVDERGQAVAKAAVWSGRLAFAEWASSQEPDSVWAASADDGSFVLEGVPVGATRLAARADGYAPAERAPLELSAGQELRGIEIALTQHKQSDDDAGFVVRVFTPAGEPVPGAEITYAIHESGGGSSGSNTADEHGTRKLACGPAGRVFVRARDPEGRFAAAGAYDVPASRGSIELHLGETTLHTLLVTDEQGKPVERYAFRIVQQPEWKQLPGLKETDVHGLLYCWLPDPGTTASFGVPDEKRVPHADGRCELRAPPLDFVIQVDARDFALAQIGPLSPASTPAEIHVTLQRLPGIHGIVLVEGKPCAGAWVKLFDAPGKQRETLVNEFPSRVMASPRLTTSSASDGSFVLELREPGDYEVQAGTPERGIAEFGPVHLVPEKGAQDLVLELPDFGALEGRVLANAGAKLRDLVVGASRGDGKPLSVRTDEQGRYRFDKLSPGRWLLRLLGEDIDPHGEGSELRDNPAPDAEFPSSCEVRAGETTKADIDLRTSAELVASVKIAGWEEARWSASLEPSGSVQCRGANVVDVDVEHLRLSVEQPGEYLLRLDAQVKGQSHSLGFEEHVLLEAGANTWSFASESGVLVLANHTPESPWVYLRSRTPGGHSISVSVQLPAHGELTLPGIPLGSWARVVWKDGKPVEDATTQVTAGASARLEWN